MNQEDGFQVFIVKISGSCNLRCSYCYYIDSELYNQSHILNKWLIEKFLWQASDISNKIHIIWHGGEPLLAGMDIYNYIIEIQNKIYNERKTIFHNSIQTNATLLNKTWVEFFKKNDFKVGISLDGNKQVHDAHRMSIGGTGSYELVMNGVKLLRENGVDFTVLSVVTKASLGHEIEIVDFFLSQGITRFEFLPCAEFDKRQPGTNKLTPYSLEPGDFSDFMIPVFDLWFKLDDPAVIIRYFEQLITGLLGGKVTLCKMRGNCSKYITINHDGIVWPCDNLIGLIKDSQIGNLNNESFSEIIKGSRRIEVLRAILTKHTKCLNCDLFQICRGGCTRYTFLTEDRTNYFCEDTKNIIQHVRQKIHQEHPLLLL